ncbi:MAG: hypothetical protein Q3979_09585 [Actinomycetaceae bacterium]|nr:hypothetical protein [Actinomycetaceae bacterium]
MFYADVVAASSDGESLSAVVGGIFLAVCVGIGVFIFNEQRIAKYEKWAKEQGFSFRRHDQALSNEARDWLDLHGHSHRAKYIVVMPSRNGTCLYGRMEWKVGYGKNQTSYDCAFARYDLKAPLPFFLAKPEGVLSRKYNDINTEWDDFNREWEIRARDREYALALLSPVMQEFIMGNMRGVELRVDGRYAYLRLSKYTIEESVNCRALMDGWEDKVVPFLWQRARSR